MADNIQDTIELLSARAVSKEEEANKLKALVNDLCKEAGIAARFGSIPTGGASIRSDQFYGLALTGAIRSFLEIRKSAGLGAASTGEIFRGIRRGGFKFGTKNDENARIVVSNALRKSSAIFHRLPNGEYGLLAWYPSAKALTANGDVHSTKKKRARKPVKEAPKEEKVESAPPAKNTSAQEIKSDAGKVTNEEVRQIVLAQTGNFMGADIERAVKAKYPGKQIIGRKIAAVIFSLKEGGKLKVVTEGVGAKGNVYSKT